ncbi:hypothetical protein QBC37DRAFT_475158 [Rhypophila decipiens]|uniref:FAD-binding domain-containing protein n=1 Tax=Rhypophila decipiens TaxID=261697 RepID=A0AAN6Y080_9PEZI|nr:hypothetical protein QBC37DRAFT_475158 [Rhypophila decipiens]
MDTPSKQDDITPANQNGLGNNHHKSPHILIIGAGISGLLLAQYLRKSGISFSVFERDTDFNTRGGGWGLTLHWSLPALRALLPDELVERLPETYVDREAVEKGKISTFPFYDLTTGELRGQSPPAPASQRVRVTREKFRRLLADGVDKDIHWGRAYKGYEAGEEVEGVTVLFEDGTSCSGTLLVGCDGSRSRVRRDLFPGLGQDMHNIPVGVLGVKAEYYTAERIRPLRELDPFFFQGTASENDTYVYFSMLDAPGSNANQDGKYTCQIVVSWPLRSGFFGTEAIINCLSTNEERLGLIQRFAQTWAEPFRSLALDIPPGTEVKPVDLHDWPPPLVSTSRIKASNVTLMGDAFHPMAMYRGEGANHAILDVLDFAKTYFSDPELNAGQQSELAILKANREGKLCLLEMYEHIVAERARPAVLASRRACMDAHNYKKIASGSPLLSRRAMKLEFENETLGWDY